MGVLACDRYGCPNIMCDRLSDTYGYICEECLEELGRNPGCDVEEFMGTLKGNRFSPDTQAAWENFLDNEFTFRGY